VIRSPRFGLKGTAAFASAPEIHPSGSFRPRALDPQHLEARTVSGLPGFLAVCLPLLNRVMLSELGLSPAAGGWSSGLRAVRGPLQGRFGTNLRIAIRLRAAKPHRYIWLGAPVAADWPCWWCRSLRLRTGLSYAQDSQAVVIAYVLSAACRLPTGLAVSDGQHGLHLAW